MKKETLMGAVAKIASLLVSATYSTDTDTDPKVFPISC